MDYQVQIGCEALKSWGNRLYMLFFFFFRGSGVRQDKWLQVPLPESVCAHASADLFGQPFRAI